MPSKVGLKTQRKLDALGQHIRHTREALGLSRKKVAAILGMDEANYAKIERGKKNVTVETLVEVAGGLGMDVHIVIATPLE